MASKKAFAGVGKAKFDNASQQNHVDSLAKNIAILAGQTQNTKDRAVLFRDLQELGVINSKGKLSDALTGGVTNNYIDSGSGGSEVDPTTEQPEQPQNVTASAAFTTVMLTWDTPSYVGHAYAEIWRNTIDQLGDMTDPRTTGEAALVSTETGSLYIDSVDYDTGYYYWVRYVNDLGDKGPVHDSSGVYAKTEKSVADSIQEIQDGIDSDLSGYQENFDEALLLLNNEVSSSNDRATALADRVDQINNSVNALGSNSIITEFDALADSSDRLADGLFYSIFNKENNFVNERKTLKGVRDIVDENRVYVIEKVYTKVDADSSIAEKIEAFQTSYVDENFTTSAFLTDNYSTTSDANSSVASRIQYLRSSYIDPYFATKSTLTQSYYTKAAVDSAISEAILNLDSEVGDIGSGYVTYGTLTQGYYTKADTDGAIAQAVLNLEAGSPVDLSTFATNATLQNDYYTKANADSAISSNVQSLQSKVFDGTGETLNASFVNKVTSAVALVDGGELAVSIDSYTVTYSGIEYTLSEVTQSAVDANGNYEQQWGVRSNTTDLLGDPHGVGFVNINGITTFAVSASNFVVFNPVDGSFVNAFSIVGGTIYANNAVIDSAVFGSLLVENKSIFEGDVLINSKLTGAKIHGAQLSADTFWVKNGAYSMTFDPSNTNAFWFGSTSYYNEDTDIDTRSQSNALVAITNQGKVVIRGLEVYDKNNNLMMSSNAGFDGTYIKDLSVDTLSIADNAVSVQSYSATQTVNIAKNSSNTITSGSHGHDGANSSGALIAFITLAVRRTSTGGGADTVNLTATVENSETGSVLVSETVTAGQPNDAYQTYFVPLNLFVSSTTSNSVRVKVVCSSNGESFTISAKVVSNSAKR
tara:strand:- start:156867 stop:159482 length:2616 start_codon:yes stop_codon:yes gene_type:complete